MQCSEIQNYFADYLKEGLDASMLAEFSQHLKECPACSAELESLTDVWVKLGPVPPGESASLDMSVRFRNSVEEYKQRFNFTPFWKRRTVHFTVAAAVLMLLVSVVMLRSPFRDSSPPAVVESVDGSLSRTWGGQTDSIHAADSISLGDVLRSDGGSASLALPDGSRIEMRTRSELFLESADDGIRIRLNSGGVIVNAAKQRSGHLYVQTRDFTVSVVGTVFFVNAEETGSRVAVIEGEVHVQQGATTRKLRAGEQVSTNPVMESQPVGTEISWSRHAEAHMALLEQSAAVAAGLAPQRNDPAQRLEFELASVKRNTDNGQTDGSPRRSGDLVMMHNTQPYSIIFYAYGLTHSYQMEGYVRLPEGWNWYDIDARTPTGATDDQVRLMFQSLLVDRFQLQVHRETKEIAEYQLIIAKGKPKLQPSSESPMTVTIDGSPGKPIIQPPGTCSISLWREGSHLVCHAATIDKIVSSLSGQLRAPVVDRTGLTGTYDLNTRYIPDDRRLDADAEPGPSLAQALEDELGLKLEKGKGPIEVIVIDHIEKPSEN